MLNKQGQKVGRKGAATRLRILDAARELLEQRGIEPGALEIATAAGISKASIYLYFRDVREIELALSVAAGKELQGLLPLLDFRLDSADLRDRALGFVQSYTELWNRNRRILLLRNFRADGGDADFIHIRDETGIPFIRKLADQFRSAPRDADVAFARAAVFFASLDRLAATFIRPGNVERIMPSDTIISAEADILAMILNAE